MKPTTFAGYEYPSQWAALGSIAAKIGCTVETLRGWVPQAERDTGIRDGVTSAERDHVKALEREVRELRRANEILRKACAYSRRRSATADPSDGEFIDDHRDAYWVEPICAVLPIASSTYRLRLYNA